MNNTNRSTPYFTEKDYEMLVIDDPRPVLYKYKDPTNEKRPSHTRTCGTCHNFKHGNHRDVCSGIQCEDINTCPTEYVKGETHMPGLRACYTNRFNAWHKRVCEWIQARNLEKLEEKKAKTKADADVQAKIGEKKAAIRAKTHFKAPAIVTQDAPLVGSPPELKERIAQVKKRKLAQMSGIDDATSERQDKKMRIEEGIGSAHDLLIQRTLILSDDPSSSSDKSVVDLEDVDREPPKITSLAQLEATMQELCKVKNSMAEFAKEQFVIDLSGATDLIQFDEAIAAIVKQREKFLALMASVKAGEIKFLTK